MKRVILVGDSIRMGYQETVRQVLEGQAEVCTPEQNGGNTAKVLDNLDEWVIASNPDIVHVNCGLHDLKKEFGAAENAIPLADYEANVRQIVERIGARTRAVVVWALTTPVNEKWHHDNKPFDRFEADVDAYNAAARRVTTDLGVPVDDLFQVAMDAGRDGILRPDGVHFTDEGSEILGKAVAECVREYL